MSETKVLVRKVLVSGYFSPSTRPDAKTLIESLKERNPTSKNEILDEIMKLNPLKIEKNKRYRIYPYNDKYDIIVGKIVHSERKVIYITQIHLHNNQGRMVDHSKRYVQIFL